MLQQQLETIGSWEAKRPTGFAAGWPQSAACGQRPVTVEEEEETAWPLGPGPVEGEEAAQPWGPGTAVDEETAWLSGPVPGDVLYLLEKCSAALIVLEICFENFLEAFTEKSLKCVVCRTLPLQMWPPGQENQDQLRKRWLKPLAHWKGRWWRG
jgi:hypothetical protein